MNATWQSDDGSVRLFLGDAMTILPHVAGDLISTDPPYGIAHPCNFHTRWRDRIAKCHDYPDVHGDNKPFDPKPLLRLGLPTILWGANHFANLLPVSPGWLVWDKKRPDTLDQSTCELAWTNCVKGVRRFAHLWNGCMKASERGENYHPTSKPVALFEWQLGLRWTRGFQTIIDPYMGAGPQGVACVRMGKSYVGMEIAPQYFEIAVARAKRALAERAAQLPFEETKQ